MPRTAVTVSDSTLVWALEARMKSAGANVALIVNDVGELLGMVRRDALIDVAANTPTMIVRELPCEAVSAPSNDDRRELHLEPEKG